MASGKYRRVSFLMVLFLLIYAGLALAGTTGKIAGRAVDKSTGEGLPGVNVIVRGTTLGATTAADGYYVILNVPPGVHTVTASMIGYTTVTVNEVRVRIDETSPVDIEMVSKAIETADVTIIAERNIVKKDVSTSVSEVQPEEITMLPVSTIGDVVGLQAGVRDGFTIRGGTADQLLFQIDGVTLRDPRNNRPISTVALSSIQEVSVERGGFNAEYGQVRSGVVNIVAREGAIDSYYGSIQAKYSPPTPKNFGMSVFDPNSMWNRPYLDPAVAWTGTQNGAWDTYTQRQYPQFEGWNAISQALLSDNDPTNDLTPAAAQKLWQFQHRRRPAVAPDYTIDASFGGPVPFVSEPLGNLRFFASYFLNREMLLIPLSREDYKEYNWSMKLNSDLTKSMKLMVNGTGGRTYNVAMNVDDVQFNSPDFGITGTSNYLWFPTDYLRTPYQIAHMNFDQRPSRIFTDSWYSQAIVNHYALAGKLTSLISGSTYYEVSFEHLNRGYDTGPTRARDTSRVYEIVPGYFVDEAPNGYSSQPYTGIGQSGMFFGGHSGQMRDSSTLKSYVLKASLSSQINKEHLIKFGVEFTSYDLKLNYGKVSPFFHDINYVNERWQPYLLSAFAQDKIEMLGFIANIGLRMDLSNPNTNWVTVDPFDKSFFSPSYSSTSDYPTEKAKTDIAFSPRLGISHPITENSKLYFNYGHFKELPAYEQIFRIGRSVTGALQNYGDPSLQQARTISYELGYDHVLFDNYLIQLAAFYKDITNQQAFTNYISDRLNISYYMANNNSYADIRGLELTLKKTHGEWLRGFANYTYQITTQGSFGKAIINQDPVQQAIIDRNTPVLYQQKPVPQPYARASLTFVTPKEFGPAFLNQSLLGNWEINILSDWIAGGFLTYNPNNVVDLINNVQLKDFFNIDMRANKIFDLKTFELMLFVEVRNLLNTKRLSGASFYDLYDQAYYFQSLHLPENPGYNNIPGNDRVGDVRKEGTAYQPIEIYGSISGIKDPNPNVIYYESQTKRYMNYLDGSWSEVDQNRMQRVLDDKAYIDMPNNSSFDFLNPRQVYFGINLTFRL